MEHRVRIKPLDPAAITIGALYRYHPVTNRPDYHVVRIVDAPWQLANGDWICKARRVDNEQLVRPWLGALEPEPTPQVP